MKTFDSISISHNIICRVDLTLREKIVLAFIIQTHKNYGAMYNFHYRDFVTNLNMGQMSSIIIIKSLCKKGWIDVIKIKQDKTVYKQIKVNLDSNIYDS